MAYFISIYIETTKLKFGNSFNKIPHAFLGLTRKHPNELDMEKEVKWYESFENLDFNDGFYGFAPVKSVYNHWGKVFTNNHFKPQWNENKQIYDYILRDKSTFNKTNRCCWKYHKNNMKLYLMKLKKK